MKQFSIVHERIPVRIINVNHYSVKLKWGTTLGICVGVSSVEHLVSATQHEPIKKIPMEISSLIVDAGYGRSEEQRKKIRDFFQNSDVFDLDDGEKGTTNIVKHKIDTGDAKAIKQTARRLPLAKRPKPKELLKICRRKGY